MTEAPAARLRRARPEEAEAITALTLRSKRHWGYSEDFMALATPQLTMSPADLEVATDHVEVLEVGGQLAAFFRLRRQEQLAFLEDLFVDPPHMGKGYGRRLFLRAAEVARGWGVRVMQFESDPFAEPFYRRLGAERVGLSPSPLMAGRTLPLLRYTL